MEFYHIPYFGEIDFSALKESYCVDMELNGNTVSIDINFKKPNADKSIAFSIVEFLKNISTFNNQNKAIIGNNFNSNGGEVREYVTFHIEELGDDFFEQLNIATESPDKEQQVLSKLKLVRIGLYPDNKYNTDCFAVFDYTPSREITDQLIVVKTDKNGNLDHISWES